MLDNSSDQGLNPIEDQIIEKKIKPIFEEIATVIEKYPMIDGATAMFVCLDSLLNQLTENSAEIRDNPVFQHCQTGFETLEYVIVQTCIKANKKKISEMN